MTRGKTLKIESWEDRSGGALSSDGESCPFGFVYFSDGSRVGFAPGARGVEDVFEPRTNGGGKYVPVTERHLEMARELLRTEGILSRDAS